MLKALLSHVLELAALFLVAMAAHEIASGFRVSILLGRLT